MRAGWLAIGLLGLSACCKSESQEPVPPAVSAPGIAATTVATTTGNATGPTAQLPAAGKLMGSCMIAGVACSDYHGSANVAPVKSACQAVGKWSDGACPAGAVGTCTKSEPGGIVNKAHTYPPGTRATSKMACDNTPGGVFSEG